MGPSAVAALLLALGPVSVAYAQAPARVTAGQEPRRVQAYFLRNEAYFLTNGQANAVALVTADGIVLVDAMSAGWGRPVTESVQRLTYMPITAVINTHAHEDHTGATAEYTDARQIVMHENSRRRLAQRGSDKTAVTTFSDRTSLTVGNRSLQVYHFGPGHTDGDAIVIMPDIGAAYVGDLFQEKALPVVDRAAGGSALGLSQTLARATAEITGVDRVITGHGRWPGSKPNTAGISLMPTWNDFRAYAEFVRAFVESITAAWKKGRTVEQAAAELQLPEPYKDYRLDGASSLIDTLFAELRQLPGAKR